jgi:hypothetical protein
MTTLMFRNERYRHCPVCRKPTAILNNGRLRRHYVTDEQGRRLCSERASDRSKLSRVA